MAGVADGDVQDMEVIVTQVYDCRTTGERLAALEARLAQTDDALTGQYAGLSRRVDWLHSDVQDMRIRLDAYGVMIRRMENRIKEVSDGSANS